MANQADLMGLGVAWPLAERLGYSPTGYAAVATLTTQAGATRIGSKLALLTVASATGNAFLLPDAPTGTFVYCTNLFASLATAQVFPGTGSLMNGVANAALTLTTGQTALFICETSGTAAATNWYSIKTA